VIRRFSPPEDARLIAYVDQGLGDVAISRLMKRPKGSIRARIVVLRAKGRLSYRTRERNSAPITLPGVMR
jgi:hypothetical protein